MNRDLNAILTVIAIGYEVNITINSIDIGVKGLKSESLKLFGKDNPSLPVLPEDMKTHICFWLIANLSCYMSTIYKSPIIR